MVKKKDLFFKKRGSQNVEDTTNTKYSTHIVETSILELENHSHKIPRVESKEFDASSLIRDPGLRPPTGNYPTSHRDEIRRAYLKFEPY